MSAQRYGGIVEYDGTGFFGYQLQPNKRTVQGEIEQVLEKITQTFIRIDAAGRTDAGVHATGQVVAFNTTWKHSLRDLHRAINATLPADIVFQRLKITPLNFSPRFDAVNRSYRYTIHNQAWPSALRRRYTHHVNQPLNIETMTEASQMLIGQHDFASFGKSPVDGRSTIRHVTQINWSVEGDCLIFEITANAFLYRMVRNVVGTLIQVGLGRLKVEQVKEILQARNLRCSVPAAPACGLCLIKVTYPEDVISFAT